VYKAFSRPGPKTPSVSADGVTEFSPDTGSIKSLIRSYDEENLIGVYIAMRTAHAYPVAANIQAVPGSGIDQVL
jgi:hypothetical protein